MSDVKKKLSTKDENDSTPDYSHRFHAANVGDVWKHCGLLAFLDGLRKKNQALTVIETHAGEGHYQLGPTGEWTEGIGKVMNHLREALPAALDRYLLALDHMGFRSDRGSSYPGSPALIQSALGPSDQMFFFEINPDAHQRLAHAFEKDPRAQVYSEDGLQGMAKAIAPARHMGCEVLIFVDPPYVSKSEWITVPDALVSVWRDYPQSHFLLWYPIKSLTRPEAMLKQLRAQGVSASAFDLITTPLELKKNRLNGSGLLFVNAPSTVLEEMGQLAPVLGRLCATHASRWFSRSLGF